MSPIEAILIWIIVGGVAGFLAGIVVRGYGLGVLRNVVIGSTGAFVAGWLLPRAGIGISLLSTTNPLLVAIGQATIGAIVLLLAINMFRRSVEY